MDARIPRIATAIALALALAACGSNDEPEQVVSPPAGDAAGDGAAGGIEPADQHLLGLTREELPEDVRIARIGDESFALTEDYVIGRRTVELDPDEAGVARVVKVTVEADHGPVTFER